MRRGVPTRRLGAPVATTQAAHRREGQAAEGDGSVRAVDSRGGATYLAAMRALRRVAVYCGSSPGARSIYVETARAVGAALAGARIGVVYGGASIGLMGAVADAALDGGVEVIGVLPRVLEGREIGHRRLSRLERVETMHERKQRMADLADGFVALPGGLGTLEELAEVLTWSMLGVHEKPCVLVDVAGYYRPLLAFLDGAVGEGFLRPEQRALLRVVEEPAALVAALRVPPGAPPTKWAGPAER